MHSEEFRFEVGQEVLDRNTGQKCRIIGISYSAGKIDPKLDSVKRKVYWTDLGFYPSNGRTESQLEE